MGGNGKALQPCLVQDSVGRDDGDGGRLAQALRWRGFIGGGKGGGIYLWESREAAERFYTPEWRAMIGKKYKGAGEIEWLENPVTVDNSGRKAKAA